MSHVPSCAVTAVTVQMQLTVTVLGLAVASSLDYAL